MCQLRSFKKTVLKVYFKTFGILRKKDIFSFSNSPPRCNGRLPDQCWCSSIRMENGRIGLCLPVGWWANQQTQPKLKLLINWVETWMCQKVRRVMLRKINSLDLVKVGGLNSEHRLNTEVKGSQISSAYCIPSCHKRD